MLEPFTRSKRAFVHAVCLARFHCEQLAADALFEPARYGTWSGPIAPLDRHFRGAPRRDEPPFEEGCDEPKGSVSGSGFPTYVRRLMKVRTSPRTHLSAHDPIRPARPDRENDADAQPHLRPVPPRSSVRWTWSTPSGRCTSCARIPRWCTGTRCIANVSFPSSNPTQPAPFGTDRLNKLNDVRALLRLQRPRTSGRGTTRRSWC